MPAVPSCSPATGNPTSDSYIHTTHFHFIDNAGRTLLMRGVNLSGSSKAPVARPSYILDDFWDAAERGGESFIGRPLNLDDGSADVHLARLSGWGFNLLRFPITWEALDHEGPCVYQLMLPSPSHISPVVNMTMSLCGTPYESCRSASSMALEFLWIPIRILYVATLTLFFCLLILNIVVSFLGRLWSPILDVSRLWNQST